MSDLSVEIQVSSKNKEFIAVKQLIVIKSESPLTCSDVLNNISKSSPLLQHVLTYIRHYSSQPQKDKDANHDDEKEEQIPQQQHIEVKACQNTNKMVANVPTDKPLYPLLQRHGWKQIHFLISDDLMMQSQVFLSNIHAPGYTLNNFTPTQHSNNTFESMQTLQLNKEFGYRRFFSRKNPLSDFTSLTEMSSLYHICMAILILFLSGILTNEALEKGVLHNFELLRWNFGQSDKVFLIWCSMFAYSFLVVVLLNHYKMRSIDRLNLGAFYCFFIMPLIIVPFRLIRVLKLRGGSAAIIACEQMRLIMKIHAYMFEMFRALHVGHIFHSLDHYMNVKQAPNKYKYLQKDWIDAWRQCMDITINSQHNYSESPTRSYDYRIPSTSPPFKMNVSFDSNIPVVVQIAHYPYQQHVNSFFNFIFCPSLVYRWSYPKHASKLHANGDNMDDEQDIGYDKVDWSIIFKNLVNMGGCLLFVFLIFYSYICPSFNNTPFEPFTVSSFLNEVFSSALPGMLLVIMCFLGVVHCWLHMWSELTGYCDTVFYEDWWNANTFASYSKKWNLVVYNWSYNYFFLPMLEAGYSKATADLFTFWLWAAVQEYVFWAVTGCWYPVLLSTCIIYGLLFYSVPFMDSSLKRNTLTGNENVDNEEERSGGGWNVFLWIMLFLQNGFFVTLYAREWYAFQAFESEQIVLDKDSFLPYSWQVALYSNITADINVH